MKLKVKDIIDKINKIIKENKKPLLNKEMNTFANNMLKKLSFLSKEKKIIFLKEILNELPTDIEFSDIEPFITVIHSVEILEENEYLIEKLNENLNEYFKKYIDNNPSISFDNAKLISMLIKEINDKKYVENYINDTNNNELVRLYLVFLKNKFNKKSLKDAYFEKKYMFSDEAKYYLLLQLSQPEITINFLDNNPNLNSEQVMTLIYSLYESMLYKKTYYRYTTYDMNNIKKYINKYIQKYLMKYPITSKLNHINDLKFGIEIESEIESEFFYSEIKFGIIGRLKFPENWRIKVERSLEAGQEIVSPPLDFSEKSEKEIFEVCNILTTIKQTATEKCGGHIHFDADYILRGGEKGIANLLEFYSNIEDLIYLIGNPVNSRIRFGAKDFAKPISRRLQTLYNNGIIKIKDEEAFREFINKFRRIYNDRYYSLNIINIGKKDKNTIEFRLPNGTIDPNVWIENINLFAAILKSSKEITDILEKENYQINLTDKEKEKICYYTNIKTSKISDEERIENLLKILFEDKKQQNIYLERYRTNKNIEENKEYIVVNFNMPNKKQPFDIDMTGFSPTKIASAVLPEVTAEDIDSCRENIEKEIKQRYFSEEII